MRATASQNTTEQVGVCWYSAYAATPSAACILAGPSRLVRVAWPALAGPKEPAGIKGRGPADCEPLAVPDISRAHFPESLLLCSCRGDLFGGDIVQLWRDGPVVHPGHDVRVLRLFDGLAGEADASRSKADAGSNEPAEALEESRPGQVLQLRRTPGAA